MWHLAQVLPFVLRRLIPAPTARTSKHLNCFFDHVLACKLATKYVVLATDVDTIREQFQRVHRTLSELYGDDIYYPKLHYVLHTSLTLRRYVLYIYIMDGCRARCLLYA